MHVPHLSRLSETRCKPAQTARFYQPELDALRFFAFACVFALHVPYEMTHRIKLIGAFGMPVFFVLSAYLITTLLLREKSRTGTVQLKAFALRRILRIWPLYFTVLFGSYVTGHFFPHVRIMREALIDFTFLMGNLFILKVGFIYPTIDALWSLSVEEQFYICVPLVAKFCRPAALALLSISAIGVAYAVLPYATRINMVHVWANSFVQFQFFGAGVLIALTLDEIRWEIAAAPRLAMAFVGIALWVPAALYFPPLGTIHLSALKAAAGYSLVLVGTSLIFLAVVNCSLPIPPHIIRLGKISYGLYLLHQIWLYVFLGEDATFMRWRYRLIRTAAALIATICTAELSFRYLERPALLLKKRFEIIPTRQGEPEAIFQ